MRPDHFATQTSRSKDRLVLALITARGGSKGLPRKNIMLAGNKPLIAWTVEAALSAKIVSRVVLSSDDEEIIAAAKTAGCDIPFIRPAHLAIDMASSIDVVLHALEQLPGFEYVILLQPTSPLRNAADIDSAFTLMLESAEHSCVSVCEADQSPYWMYQLTVDNKLERLIPEIGEINRRQDLPKVYVLNGAIYIARVDWLLEKKKFVSSETVAYLMPKERSLDIDTAQDFEIFRSKIEGRSNSIVNN